MFIETQNVLLSERFASRDHLRRPRPEDVEKFGQRRRPDQPHRWKVA